MSILKAAQIRQMGKKELEEQLGQLKTELRKEQSAIASGTRPENSGKIREMRRTIARILTIQSESKKNKKEVEVAK